MWPNPQFLADLVTFTEEIFNRKLLRSDTFNFMFFENLLEGRYIQERNKVLTFFGRHMKVLCLLALGGEWIYE